MPNPIQLAPNGDLLAALNALPVAATLLLPRGETFNVPAGRGPLVLKDGQTIGSYWDETKPKPPRPRIVFAGDKIGVDIGGSRDVKLDSVQVEAAGNGKCAGVEIHDAANILLENCVVRGWRMNVTVKKARGLVVRGCLIADSWTADAEDFGHSSGLYAYQTTGIVLDRSAFVGNGYKPGTAKPTIFNHGVYIHGSCGPSDVFDCTFVANSSHGLQQRSGGNARGNLFWDNPIGHSHGLVNGSLAFKGGVGGAVERNVYVGGATIDGERRGYALEFGNAASTIARDLLAAHDSQKHDAPFLINPCQRVTNPGEVVSPCRVEMTRVFAYQWPGFPPTRTGVLRVATPAVGGRERVEVLPAAAPAVDLRALLGDVEAAARRDPWVCAARAVRAARNALGLDGPTPGQIAAARARVKAIDLEDAALVARRAPLSETIAGIDAKRRALAEEREELMVQIGGDD